jgi:hypothetical protein
MYKPISLAILSGLAAAGLVLLNVPGETMDSDCLTTLGQQWADEWHRDQRLTEESARTYRGILRRESLIDDLLAERVSLDEVRCEFRIVNDESPACWFLVRLECRGGSDQQCLDRQIRTYLQARRAPHQQVSYERLVTHLRDLPQSGGDQP